MTTAPPRPRSRRPRVGVVPALIGVVLVAGAVALLLPEAVGLATRSPFTAFVALRPVGVVVAVVVALALVAARRRWWPTTAALLVVAVIAGSFVVPRLIADEPAAPPPGPALRLLSFNVDEGGADLDALATVLRERRPDLVVLPESAERFRGLVVAAVPELGYRSWVAAAPGAPDVHGVTVLAAPGVGDLRARPLTDNVDPWLELTGGTLGGVRLVALHTAAPTPGKLDAWPRELAELQQWCAAPGPGVVLAGDVNATEDHAPFRAGTAGCRDAGERSGEGLVATWPTRWPRWLGAQIDHVLTGGGVDSRGLEVVDIPGSDHRALLSTVSVP